MLSPWYRPASAEDVKEFVFNSGGYLNVGAGSRASFWRIFQVGSISQVHAFFPSLETSVRYAFFLPVWQNFGAFIGTEASLGYTLLRYIPPPEKIIANSPLSVELQPDVLRDCRRLGVSPSFFVSMPAIQGGGVWQLSHMQLSLGGYYTAEWYPFFTTCILEEKALKYELSPFFHVLGFFLQWDRISRNEQRGWFVQGGYRYHFMRCVGQSIFDTLWSSCTVSSYLGQAHIENVHIFMSVGLVYDLGDIGSFVQ